MPEFVSLRGHSFLHDQQSGEHHANTLWLMIDIDHTTLMVGVPGERDMEEMVFQDREVRHAFQQWADAVRRRAYRRRPITPVPKPISDTCELCHGRKTFRNPYSGEVFTCPSCHE